MPRLSTAPILACLLLLLAPLAAWGQDANPSLGKWYLQTVDGERIPDDVRMVIDFRADGNVYASEEIEGQADESPEVTPYRYDPQTGTLTITEGGEQIVFKATVTESALTLVGDDDGREMTMVLTRAPGGDNNAQPQDQAQPATPGHPVNGNSRRTRGRQMQSATQLRGIHQGLVIAAQPNKGKYPADLGVLLAGDFVTAEYLLAPWSPIESPEDIDDWDEARKAAWANANTTYCFVMPGQENQLDAERVVLFELPIYADTATIGICFDDNHVERKPYAEADALIKAQTGKDIMQWMEALGREQIAWEPGPDAEAAPVEGDGVDDAGKGEPGEDAAGEGDWPDGPQGTWYVQKMEGQWLPAADEFRLEFRDDGTAHIFENGEPEDEVMRYVVLSDKRVIQIIELDSGELEIELRYALYDDIMVLNFDQGGGEDEQMIFCRRPQGNEEHQRERAKAQGDNPREGRDDAGDAAGDAVEDILEEAGDEIEDIAE